MGLGGGGAVRLALFTCLFISGFVYCRCSSVQADMRLFRCLGHSPGLKAHFIISHSFWAGRAALREQVPINPSLRNRNAVVAAHDAHAAHSKVSRMCLTCLWTWLRHRVRGLESHARGGLPWRGAAAVPCEALPRRNWSAAG